MDRFRAAGARVVFPVTIPTRDQQTWHDGRALMDMIFCKSTEHWARYGEADTSQDQEIRAAVEEYFAFLTKCPLRKLEDITKYIERHRDLEIDPST